MPNKLQEYSLMAESTAAQITGSFQSWLAFLDTAARLYKYPYNEQLLIFAQRPDATACAEYKLWNNTMGRYVRRDSKGIALIDTSGMTPRLKYVFDVSDTGARPNSRAVNLWEYRDGHREAVGTALERAYDIPASGSLPEQLEKIAAKLAGEYWTEHQRDVLDIVADSYLEAYDEFNVGAAFRSAATVSITYALMSRCGLEPRDYFQHEDFLNVFDFNTPATVGALGTAVSEINQQVLRQIEASIKKYEREHSADTSRSEHTASNRNEIEALSEPERMNDNGRADLHPERGLSDSRPEPGRDGGREAAGQVRPDAEGVPEGASPDPVEPPDSRRDAANAPAGDRRDGAPAPGADDAGAGDGERRDGGPESQRPAALDGPDEQPESTGGRDDPDRAGLQLTRDETPAEEESGQFSLFLSEAEQIRSIDEAESAFTDAPFAFSAPQAVIDDILRNGSNTDHSRMRVVAEFSKEKAPETKTAFLKQEYHGGYGLNAPDGKYAAWYDGDGIHISRGGAARYAKNAQVIPWKDAAARIDELLIAGEFASNVELTEAAHHERMEIAESLWYLRRDFSDAAQERDFLPSLSEIRGNNFPDETEKLAELLANDIGRANVLREYREFYAAYQENAALLRFRYHKTEALLHRLEDMGLPRREYTSELADIPAASSFITDDEINRALTGGSGMEGGRGRIYAFFRENHTPKEKADFLKKEYGVGGRSHALSGCSGSYEDHNNKGIKYQKRNCYDVELSWAQVAKRIETIIGQDRYLSAAEKARYAAKEEALSPVPESAQEDVLVEAQMQEQQTAAPLVKRDVTQTEIDDVLRAWNGSTESKRAVVRYMEAHARERDTINWMARGFAIRWLLLFGWSKIRKRKIIFLRTYP